MRSVSNIDLRLLRVFVAVTECGSYAAAQSRLNIGTSTISLHMTELEERLGFRLCDRGRSGFRLTERGGAVYSEAKSVLRSLDDFAASMATLTNQLSGRLVIGMVDNLITHPNFAMVHALRSFHAKPNKVYFDLFTASREELEQSILQGTIHAAIGPFVRRINGLSLKPLFKETHRVYCGQGHPLFSKTIKKITPDVVNGLPVVIRSYHDQFDLAHFAGGWPAATVRNLEAMVVLLLSGAYIGFLPIHVAEPWVQAGQLYPVGGNDSTYVSEHMLITRKGMQAPRALTAFLDVLVAQSGSADQFLSILPANGAPARPAKALARSV
jgi:DNA-binding transcriptional LysR family regulator